MGVGQYTDAHRDVTLTGVGVSQYTNTHRDETMTGVEVGQYTDTHRDVTLTGVGGRSIYRYKQRCNTDRGLGESLFYI